MKQAVNKFTASVLNLLCVAVSHCPKCHASKGWTCETAGGNKARQPHAERKDRARNHILAVNIGANSTFYVDPTASLDDMQQKCPLFFRTAHGKRETYTPYRGCLIVRNTVTFTGCKPVRKTAIYLFGQHCDTFNHDFSTVCFCYTFPSVAVAKRVIDEVLDQKSVEKALPMFYRFY